MKTIQVSEDVLPFSSVFTGGIKGRAKHFGRRGEPCVRPYVGGASFSNASALRNGDGPGFIDCYHLTIGEKRDIAN